MFVSHSSPNSYAEILMPNVIIVVGGAFGIYLSHEDGDFTDGIIAL